jgi:hypothetical protein
MSRAASTMVHVEWNALTYAGHTTWNVHVGESTRKRNPREEWLIQRNTHEALITDAEAEALLAQLATSDIGRAVSAAKGAVGRHLLGGLLVAPNGQPWRGEGQQYRLRNLAGGRGHRVSAAIVDQAVLGQLRHDLSDLAFWRRLLDAAKALRVEAPDISQEVAKLEREKERAAKLAVTTDEPGQFLEIVQARSREIAALRREAEARKQEQGLPALVARTTPAELAEMALSSPERAVSALVERVVLSPDLDCRIEYRAPGGRTVALPGRTDRSPAAVSAVRLAG